MTNLSSIKDRIAEAQDLIRRFDFTARLGNPASIRIVDEARRELAAAEQELAAAVERIPNSETANQEKEF